MEFTQIVEYAKKRLNHAENQQPIGAACLLDGNLHFGRIP